MADSIFAIVSRVIGVIALCFASIILAFKVKGNKVITWSGFFASSIANAIGISQAAIQQYSKAKSQLRDAGLKCKSTEIRLAREHLQTTGGRA